MKCAICDIFFLSNKLVLVDPRSLCAALHHYGSLLLVCLIPLPYDGCPTIKLEQASSSNSELKCAIAADDLSPLHGLSQGPGPLPTKCLGHETEFFAPDLSPGLKGWLQVSEISFGNRGIPTLCFFLLHKPLDSSYVTAHVFSGNIQGYKPLSRTFTRTGRIVVGRT